VLGRSEGRGALPSLIECVVILGCFTLYPCLRRESYEAAIIASGPVQPYFINHALLNQLGVVNLVHRVLLPNLLVHQWLCEGRLIGLVVAKATIANNINDNVTAVLLPPLQAGKRMSLSDIKHSGMDGYLHSGLAATHNSLSVITVDMEDRS
jgi:hypothetical protein